MRKARAALVCGVIGLPLCLLSYVWIPFAGTRMGNGVILYVVIVSELGALAAGASAVALGLAARRYCPRGTVDRQMASRGSIIGAIVLLLVLVPNIVGNLLASR